MISLELRPEACHLPGERARGGMADAPDLGSGSERIGGSSPLARTIVDLANFRRCATVRRWSGERAFEPIKTGRKVRRMPFQRLWAFRLFCAGITGPGRSRTKVQL